MVNTGTFRTALKAVEKDSEMYKEFHRSKEAEAAILCASLSERYKERQLQIQADSRVQGHPRTE